MGTITSFFCVLLLTATLSIFVEHCDEDTLTVHMFCGACRLEVLYAALLNSTEHYTDKCEREGVEVVLLIFLPIFCHLLPGKHERDVLLPQSCPLLSAMSLSLSSDV